MVRHHAYSAPLVQHIQSKLKAEHNKLLSYDILTMIFNSPDDSTWDEGNKVAYEAPLWIV